MKFGYITDRGRRRKKNEDSIKIISNENFFMLADGVGGNKSGEIASKCALEALEKYVRENPLDAFTTKEEIFRYFLDAVNFVNQYILAISDTDIKYEGMATTLVFAYIKDDTVYVANVGDSRLYIVENEELKQVTDDHTYVNDLVKKGIITKEEAINHKKKNLITKAIGVSVYVRPDCFCLKASPDSRLLICSDGLYDEVSDSTIRDTLISTDDMQQCADELVDKANSNGGNDNISVICIRMEE